jgi:hypothetical protein
MLKKSEGEMLVMLKRTLMLDKKKKKKAEVDKVANMIKLKVEF